MSGFTSYNSGAETNTITDADGYVTSYKLTSKQVTITSGNSTNIIKTGTVSIDTATHPIGYVSKGIYNFKVLFIVANDTDGYGATFYRFGTFRLIGNTWTQIGSTDNGGTTDKTDLDQDTHTMSFIAASSNEVGGGPHFGVSFDPSSTDTVRVRAIMWVDKVTLV